MKRLSLLVLLLSAFGITQLQAQNPIRKGEKQLNFGTGVSVFGIPVYVGMDFGIHEDISLGPVASFRSYVNTYFDPVLNRNVNYTETVFGIGFTADYHFNNLLDIPREFDIYAGAGVSYFIVNANTNNVNNLRVPNIGVNPHVGARYNFNPKWSVQVQVDAGTHTGALGGLTMKL